MRSSVPTVLPLQVRFSKHFTCFPLPKNALYRIWRPIFPYHLLCFRWNFSPIGFSQSPPTGRPSRYLSKKPLLSMPSGSMSLYNDSFMELPLGSFDAALSWRCYSCGLPHLEGLFRFVLLGVFLLVIFDLIFRQLLPVGFTDLGSLPYDSCV